MLSMSRRLPPHSGLSARPLPLLAGMLVLGLLSVAIRVGAASAAEVVAPIEIHIKDHRFHPDVIEIPASTKVRLIVHNDDAEPEEFESEDFNSEKVIRPGRSATIFLPPMRPGEYRFWGEFHRDTAQGRAIAK